MALGGDESCLISCLFSGISLYAQLSFVRLASFIYIFNFLIFVQEIFQAVLGYEAIKDCLLKWHSPSKDILFGLLKWVSGGNTVFEIYTLEMWEL